VVDDEEFILKVIGDLLKSKGYDVVSAQSGKDALNQLKKIKPDLIILDFFMPEMSGREVCEQIRLDDKLKKLKVMFLTAAVFSKQGLDELKQLGSLAYMQKPFDNKKLIETIKKII